jgi:hypothetical protein
VWNAFRMLDKLRRKQEISRLKHKATDKHRQHTETYGFLVFYHGKGHPLRCELASRPLQISRPNK